VWLVRQSLITLFCARLSWRTEKLAVWQRIFLAHPFPYLAAVSLTALLRLILNSYAALQYRIQPRCY